MSLADLLLRLALAPPCAACGEPLAHPTAGCVCPTCWNRIEPPSPRAWASPHVREGRSGGAYDGALRQIIHAYKYDGRRSLARPLAALMRREGGELIALADCVVPVPLHPWRRMRRGFNQAGDLARLLGPPTLTALWRARWTADRIGLSAAERRRNVTAAFRASPLMGRAAWERFIEERVVMLVDDVHTTGATLDACAAILRARGAREVVALTAATRPLGNQERTS